MSISRGGRLVIDDAAHDVVRPLIRRAGRFGPYFWLEVLAVLVSANVVEASTGSMWLGIAWMAGAILLLDSTAADEERVVALWLEELDKEELER